MAPHPGTSALIDPMKSLSAAQSFSHATPDDQFRADAAEILGNFRQAMERIIYSVAKGLQNSRDLQNVLGVDRNVSWQIFKLLGPIETLSTVSYIPAAVSFRKVLSAAKKRGVSEESLSAATVAFAAFESFVMKTTGDREQFETVVMSYADSAESAQMGMHHRKAAFKADCHFFGFACDTLSHALFFHPGKEPGKMDFVGLRQMMGLRRLRASTDVVVDRWKTYETALDGQDNMLLSDALDNEAASKHNAAVLPEFCSKPMLPLVTQVDEAGDVRTLLKHRDIGVGREVDITTARMCSNMALTLTPDGRPMFHGLIEIARPTRLHIVDNFIHRPTWPNLVPYSGVFAHLPRRVASKVDREAVQLPFTEPCSYMGTGADVLRIREIPRFPESVRYVCQKMGWNFDDMDLYRIRIEYPLMDSNILLRLESTAAK